MQIESNEIKYIIFKVSQNDSVKECFVGYDAISNLTIDCESNKKNKQINETQFNEFKTSLIDLMQSWDYEYNNPLAEDDFIYHIEFVTYDKIKVVFEGFSGFASNYKQVCNLIRKYTGFSMWCGIDCFRIYEDYLAVEPIYQLMSYFQEGDVDDKIQQIDSLVKQGALYIEDHEEIIKQYQVDLNDINNFDIEKNDVHFAKAVFSYYYKKCFIDDHMEGIKDQSKLLNALYKIIESNFFKNE